MAGGASALYRSEFAIHVQKGGVTPDPEAPMIHRAYRTSRNRNSFEITWSMTSFTFGAKVSSVRIAVALEATMTSHRKSQIQLRYGNVLPSRNAQRCRLCGPRLMAQEASRFLVWPYLLELRHAVVVELRRSLLGAVALGAVLAKLAVVLVVLLMTVETAVLAQLVLVFFMT